MIKLNDTIGIVATVEDVLQLVKLERPEYFHDIKVSPGNLVVTCPFHGSGLERTPSCFINTNEESDIPVGTYHCFGCGAKGRLRSLVSYCLDVSKSEADEWLLDNFKSSYAEEVKIIDRFEFGKKAKKEYLDESILDTFEYNNINALNYLINKRHLSKDVVDYFKVGYNTETASVTFPCRDTSGRLVGIFERNILSKRFHIPKINPKPVYLLYEVCKLKYNFVFVVESQINALSMFSWGYPAVALFGTGSKSQYNDLARSGIRKFCCVFDGDDAGREGLKKLANNMPSHIMLFYKIVPEGKDVNDLNKEEFDGLPMYSLC